MPSAGSAGTTVERGAAKKASGGVPAGRRRKAESAVPAVEDASAGIGLVKCCVAALEEKKADAIKVFFLGEKSPVADYCVIATGTSDPHLRALRTELEKAIRAAAPSVRVRIQNEPGSGWCVVDAFDVVVHVFSREQREKYALDEFFAQGEPVELPAK